MHKTPVAEWHGTARRCGDHGIGGWHALLLGLCGLLFASALSGTQSTLPAIVVDDALLARVDEAIAGRLRAIDATRLRTLGDPGASDAQRAEDTAELGFAAFVYELDDLALASFAHAEAFAPQDARWPHALGAIHQRARRLEPAIEAFERSLHLAPDTPSVRVRLAQVLLLLGDAENARSHYRLLLNQAPWAAAAHYGLGRLAAQAGNSEEAIHHLEAARSRQPRAAEVAQQLGLAYRDAGNRDKARELLAADATGSLNVPDRLLGNLEDRFPSSDLLAGFQAFRDGKIQQAIGHYQQAVAKDPNNPVYQQALGAALLEAAELDGAIDAFRAAVRIDPEQPEAHLRLANTIVRTKGLDDEAEHHFQEALRLVPGMVDAHVDLAKALATGGKLEEASSHFAAAAEAAPDDLGLRRLWVRCLLQIEKEYEASQLLDEILEAEPDDVGSLVMQAVLLTQAGRFDRARALARRGLELDVTPEQRGELYFRLARIAVQESRFEDAVGHFQSALEVAPDMQLAHLGLANLYSNGRRHREAAVHYTRLLEIDAAREGANTPLPNRKTVLFNLATALGYAGELDEAARRFREVVALDGQDADAYLGLTSALRVAGREAEARDALTDGLEALDDHPALSIELARLLLDSPVTTVRDPARALSVARRAFDARPSPALARVVAEAMIRNGRGSEVEPWLRGVLDQAERAGAPESVRHQLRQLLAGYSS